MLRRLILLCIASACTAFSTPPGLANAPGISPVKGLMGGQNDHLARVAGAATPATTWGWRPVQNSDSSSSRRGARMMCSADSGDILVLDHVNINHEKGRHDLLKAFYFDVLGCAVDPRKIENLDKGKKTLWANTGIQQFHLPEEESAQIFAGTMVLHYSSLDSLRARLASPPPILSSTRFSYEDVAPDSILVSCPWGNRFEVRGSSDYSRDARGTQPGEMSEALGMPLLKVDVPHGSNMEGIQRFYTQVMAARAEMRGRDVVVHCGAGQEMIFTEAGPSESVVHSDYHISMYIKDLASTFTRAQGLGIVFVNPRFKRKAHTLEEAVDQCMFRIRDVIDPLEPEAGPIIQLEHEIRSTKNEDGTPYKSCPLRNA